MIVALMRSSARFCSAGVTPGVPLRLMALVSVGGFVAAVRVVVGVVTVGALTALDTPALVVWVLDPPQAASASEPAIEHMMSRAVPLCMCARLRPRKELRGSWPVPARNVVIGNDAIDVAPVTTAVWAANRRSASV